MPEGKEKEKVEMRMGIKNGDLELVINNFLGLVSPRYRPANCVMAVDPMGLIKCCEWLEIMIWPIKLC
jgi:hypothetical protein